MGAAKGLFRAAGTIVAVTVLSKLLGFLRETSLASVFGATHATDAYLVAQTIPYLVFASVGVALGTTFIPVMAETKEKRGIDEAWRMTSTVINATIILAVFFIAFGELLAGPLARLVAPGFGGEVYRLTVHLSRIMFPMVLFQALSGIVGGVLQTENNFTVPAVVGLSFNAIIIGTTLLLGPMYGIQSVAVGTVVAIIVQTALQVPALRRLGYRWQPVLDLRDKGLRRIAILVVPVLIATAVGQMGLVVDRMLASGLAEGSISALNYANRLMTLVPSIFGTAIVTVMFPTLAKFVAAREWERFRAAFAQAAKVVNFIMLPVAMGQAVLRGPIVRLVFERGAFDAAATEATAWALLFFCVGVAVFSLRELINRAFFAVQDTTVPMIVGAVSVVINIVFNLLLVRSLKQGGLALATSLAGVFGVAVLLWKLRRRVGGIGGKAILSSLWRVALASAVMGVAVWASYAWLERTVEGVSVAAQSVRLGGAIVVGCVTYGLLVWMMKVPEMTLAIGLARQVVGKTVGIGFRFARRLAPGRGRM